MKFNGENYERVWLYLLLRFDNEIISSSILSLPLIQVGQLSVTDKSMGMYLVLVKHLHSSSRINVHLMFPLFPENRKSIPNFLVVILFSQKYNLIDFKFYPSVL